MEREPHYELEADSLKRGEKVELLCPDSGEYHGISGKIKIDLISHQGGQRCKYDHNEDSAIVACTKELSEEEKVRDITFVGVIDAAGSTLQAPSASQILADRMAHFFAQGVVEKKDIIEVDKLLLTVEDIDTEELDISHLSTQEMINRAFQEANDTAFSRFGEDDGYGCAAVCGIDYEKKEIVLGNVGDTRGLIIVEKHDGKVEIVKKTQIHNWAAIFVDGERDVNSTYLKQSPQSKAGLTQALGNKEEYAQDIKPDFQTYIAQPGDIVTVVLASDGGIGDRISDYEVLEAYKKSGRDSKKLQQILFDLALARNGEPGNIPIKVGPGEKEIYYLNNIPQGGEKGMSDNITIATAQVKF